MSSLVLFLWMCLFSDIGTALTLLSQNPKLADPDRLEMVSSSFAPPPRGT